MYWEIDEIRGALNEIYEASEKIIDFFHSQEMRKINPSMGMSAFLLVFTDYCLVTGMSAEDFEDGLSKMLTDYKRRIKIKVKRI